YRAGQSIKQVGTQEFADHIIANLGKTPEKLTKSELQAGKGEIRIPDYIRKEEKKELVGVDVFLDWPHGNPQELGEALSHIDSYKLKLKMITNRGVKV
ncbi:MAG: NADP-dependent isocitrate dehydrogenase, partial [Luteibaculum sp.]